MADSGRSQAQQKSYNVFQLVPYDISTLSTIMVSSTIANLNSTIMEEKVSAVVGDISKERLGMDPSTFTSLATKLHVIVNSAATTGFDER